MPTPGHATHNQKAIHFQRKQESEKKRNNTTSHVIMSLNGAKIMSTYVFHRVCGAWVCVREPQAMPLIFICRLKSFPSFGELYVLFYMNKTIINRSRIKSADTEIKQANTFHYTAASCCSLMYSYISYIRTDGIHVAVYNCALFFSSSLLFALFVFIRVLNFVCARVNQI